MEITQASRQPGSGIPLRELYCKLPSLIQGTVCFVSCSPMTANYWNLAPLIKQSGPGQLQQVPFCRVSRDIQNLCCVLPRHPAASVKIAR